MKISRRLAKIVLVWTVIATLSLNIVLAGRRAHRLCAPTSQPRCSVVQHGSKGPVQSGKSGAVQKGVKGLHKMPAPAADAMVPTPPSMSDPSYPPTSPSDVPPRPVETPPATQQPFTPAPTQPAPTRTPLTPDPQPAPRDESLDDLFDDPRQPAPRGESEPAPQPAPEQPSEPLNDLFDTPASPPESQPPSPESNPATPADDPLNDLFSDPPEAQPTAPANDPLDDLFGDPTPATPTTNERPAAPASDPLDDLFGDPTDSGASNRPVRNPIASGRRVTERSMARSIQDPNSATRAVSTVEPLAVRRWVDDSGWYSIEGKLIALLDGKVRIEKVTGRTCTVSLDRLSRADVAYVQGVRGRVERHGSLQLTN